MPESPPRKRFQIHLSTAIVLMFVAGALLWANTHPKTTITYRDVYLASDSFFDITGTTDANFIRTEKGSLLRAIIERSYGWPFNIRTDSRLAWVKKDLSLKLDDDDEHSWTEINAIINTVIAIVLLIAAWYLLEWRIRRRTSRKDA